MPGKSKAPQHSILHYVDGNQNKTQAHHPLTAEDRYRESYFEAVDNIISAIRQRFKQTNFEAYENLESLIVKAIASKDVSKKTSYLEANYGTEININQFWTVEADILRTIFRKSKLDCFWDILDEIESLPKRQICLLPNAVKILKLLLVNLATTATPKRSSLWPGELKHGFAQPPRRLTSTHCQFFMPISPSLIQLIWLRSQMNSHQNSILENVFSGGFKMALKFNWKRLFKFYRILIFVFSFFWCIQSFKTQLDETWSPNVWISTL